MVRLAGSVLLATALLAFPGTAPATEEYAACSGRDCGHCHESPGGGGALTPAGEAFAAAVAGPGRPAPAPLRRAGSAALLFLHVAAGFMWFGTILYVHLILKPAYAAGGLPRGEVRLGWSGIVVVGATGAALALERVPSLEALFHTRYGLLLTVKIALFLVMAGTAFLVTFVVGPRLGRRPASGNHPGQGTFSAGDLAAFDGGEGRRALVAHGGRVYDLTASRLWAEGSHMRQHAAGRDLTGALERAPHGAEKLAPFPVVGDLAAEAPGGRSPHERGFYVMAYLNLGIVAAVLLVIALMNT